MLFKPLSYQMFLAIYYIFLLSTDRFGIVVSYRRHTAPKIQLNSDNRYNKFQE